MAAPPPRASAQPDLFAQIFPTCGACGHLGAAIGSGVRYCTCLLMWRWPHERPECVSFREAA